MKVHLVDGTYELFRMFYGAPPADDAKGREVGATRALLRSLLMLLGQSDVTHVAVAFDHVIESFRNDLFAGYKTGAGIEPALYSQFPLAERAVAALGIVVWPMIEFEADDAIAAAALRFGADERVSQVVICSPDKDLAQCVVGDRVVLWDRRREIILDEPGVRTKFGIGPRSIPDYLALVGDSADGIPGIPRWGARSAAAILARYEHLEAIPEDARTWTVKLRGAPALAESLGQRRADSLLYKRLATLRTDTPLEEKLEDLEWQGADRSALEAMCAELDDARFLERVGRFRG
jgi:5'-3' exonuclease